MRQQVLKLQPQQTKPVPLFNGGDRSRQSLTAIVHELVVNYSWRIKEEGINDETIDELVHDASMEANIYQITIDTKVLRDYILLVIEYMDTVLGSDYIGMFLTNLSADVFVVMTLM